MRGWGRGREERQVQEAERDLYPGYLQVSLQPVKLSLYQVAAIMEEEIHLSGEGDDVCRTQIPAEGQTAEVRDGVSSASPILQGREASPSAPPGYLYHRPSLFPGMLKRAL